MEESDKKSTKKSTPSTPSTRSNLDLWVMLLSWLVAVIVALLDLVVYSTFPPYDTDGYPGSGTVAAGVSKAVEGFISFVFIAVFYTAIVLSQRLIVRSPLKKPSQSSSSRSKRTWRNLFDTRGKKLRLLLICAATFFALPWIFAIFGGYISDVPVLNAVFIARQPFEGYPSVHVGQHHGFDGYVIVVLILVAVETASLITNKYLNAVFGIAACAFLYMNLYRFVEDFVDEQIYKRGIQLILPSLGLTSIPLIALGAILGLPTYFLVWRRYFQPTPL
nr:hypothetical protein [Candidatus Njordarchaeum guaymaensis]